MLGAIVSSERCGVVDHARDSGLVGWGRPLIGRLADTLQRMNDGRPVQAAKRVIGYMRVSTAEQADGGAGLASQRYSIERAAEGRAWQIAAFEIDAGISGKTTVNRPALARALHAVECGDADILVVSKLDRLSRSVADFASILDRAQRGGWGLVALDLGVDTTTPAGELVANVMAAVAQWERRVIGQRTQEGLAARRAAGVRLGRPPALDFEIVARIVQERATGRSLRAIADGLTRDGMPTARGGIRWSTSSIHAILRSPAAAAVPKAKSHPAES